MPGADLDVRLLVLDASVAVRWVVPERGAAEAHRDEAIIQPALALALTAQHKVADCLYLALAEHCGAGLATADRRLGELARSRHVPHVLLPSA